MTTQSISSTETVNANVTNETTENTMNTSSTTPVSSVSASAVPADATPSAAPAPVPAPPAPPPANALIPSSPTGFTPQAGGFAVGTKPRKSELGVLPDALVELQSFVDWSGTLGKTVPPQAQTLQTLTVADQWSIMRIATQSWAKYCANEEGVAWTGARQVMDRVVPAFALALQGDPTLATTYPKLTAFLGAKKVIAKKSASTRSKNKKSVAAGEAPTHGAVGKKATKKAEKAALAAANAAAKAQAVAPAVTPAPVNGATRA